MSMRAVVVSLFALVLLVGCGGDDADSNGDAPDAPTATVQTDNESTDSSSDSSSEENSSNDSVEILTVRGGVPNTRADVTVRTEPNASCNLVFTTPDGAESAAQGLGDKAATGNGRVSWSWQLAADLTPGTGTVIVTCDGVSVESPIEIG